MGKSGAKKKKPAAAAKTSPSSAESAAEPPPPAAAPAANGAGPHQAVDAGAVLRRAHELKEEGNRLFQLRDYAAALRQYELALRIAPPGHPDRAVFHSNRAACLLQLRPVDHEAVALECSLALQAEPRFPRALLRRARALEALGRHELALADALALLALDPNHRDAIDLSHRLRSRVNAAAAAAASASSAPEPTSRPSPAALGASAVVAGLGPSLPARPFPKKQSAQAPLTPPSHSNPSLMSKSNPPPSPKLVPFSNSPPSSAKPSAADSSRKATPTLPVNSSLLASAAPIIDRKVVTRWRPLKLVYDHDIRLGQIPEKCSFRTLREFVAKRFPSSKAVLIKYKDADCDLVTITSTEELWLAESFVDKVGHEVIENGKEVDNKLQVLRLHLVEVSPEQEPALPTEEEKLEEEELLVKGEDSTSHTPSEVADAEVTKQDEENRVAEQSLETGKKDCGHAECKEAEIDDWLLQFAELFRNQVGIDADAHLDLHELGMELCSEALEETVTSEEAQALFEMAASKFQEVAALALFNWGNVHMCAARKRIPLDESASKEVMAAQLRTAYDWVRERYALAGHKYEEALKIKPDFYEGLLALGQQHFETAKLHWSFALADKVDLSTWDSSETFKLFDSAEHNMRAATEMWEKVEEQRMTELKEPGAGEKDELLRKKKQQQSADGQPELTPEEAAEQAAVMRQQIHLFWGNMLFERSQVEFKLSIGDWKKNLDASVERFKLAGASESDISAVLKNHFSNAVSECEEKKVMTSGTEVSQANDNIEDKCVVES
ncbi:unnamed protein product [Urochloa humidicola]